MSANYTVNMWSFVCYGRQSKSVDRLQKKKNLCQTLDLEHSDFTHIQILKRNQPRHSRELNFLKPYILILFF